MVRVTLCDGNENDRNQLAYLLRSYKLDRQNRLELTSFSDPAGLADLLESGPRQDLFLLEVLLPGAGGIALGAQIRAKCPGARIIYLTASREHALDAFRVGARQYLLKPVAPADLYAALDDALHDRIRGRQIGITVKTKGGLVHILYTAILYIESNDHTVVFHLENREEVRTVNLRVCFERFLRELLEDPRFLHVHKSYVVNMDHIRRFSSGELLMSDCTLLTVPRKNITAARERYLGYLAAGDFLSRA